VTPIAAGRRQGDHRPSVADHQNWASPAWLAIQAGQALQRFTPSRKLVQLSFQGIKGRRRKRCSVQEAEGRQRLFPARTSRPGRRTLLPLGGHQGLRPPFEGCLGIFSCRVALAFRKAGRRSRGNGLPRPGSFRKASWRQGGTGFDPQQPVLLRLLAEGRVGRTRVRRGGSQLRRVLQGRSIVGTVSSASIVVLQADGRSCSRASGPPGVGLGNNRQRIGQLRPGLRAGAAASVGGSARASSSSPAAPDPIAAAAGRRWAATGPSPHRGRGAVAEAFLAAPLLLGLQGAASLLVLWCWLAPWRALRPAPPRPAAASDSSLARAPVVGPPLPGQGALALGPPARCRVQAVFR